jgi:hypothetical protein
MHYQPGEVLQTDGTYMNDLHVTLQGEVLANCSIGLPPFSLPQVYNTCQPLSRGDYPKHNSILLADIFQQIARLGMILPF